MYIYIYHTKKIYINLQWGNKSKNMGIRIDKTITKKLT